MDEKRPEMSNFDKVSWRTRLRALNRNAVVQIIVLASISVAVFLFWLLSANEGQASAVAQDVAFEAGRYKSQYGKWPRDGKDLAKGLKMSAEYGEKYNWTLRIVEPQEDSALVEVTYEVNGRRHLMQKWVPKAVPN